VLMDIWTGFLIVVLLIVLTIVVHHIHKLEDILGDHHDEMSSPNGRQAEVLPFPARDRRDKEGPAA
jgi:hypothetical protein